MAAAGREWGGAMAAVAERTGALQGLLWDHGQGGAPAGELRRLLASGALSPPLHQWLTASLGEAEYCSGSRMLGCHSAVRASTPC